MNREGKYKPGFLYMLKCRLARKDYVYYYFFKGKKTLDVGCGPAEFMKNSPGDITGIEANGEVVARLKAKGYNAVESKADSLPFGDEQFEAIHCRNVIEHLEVDEAYAMLRECQRVLKPRGIFVLGSEMVTNKFWGTFGHVKPYPPGSILKLLREESRESFTVLRDLEYRGVSYLGNYHRWKIVYLMSAWLGYVLPSLFAREYFMVFTKKAGQN